MEKRYRVSSTLTTLITTVDLDERLKVKLPEECAIWALNYFVDDNDRPIKDMYFVGRRSLGSFSNSATTNSKCAALITASRYNGKDCVTVTLATYGRYLVTNHGRKDWVYDIAVTEENGNVVKGFATLAVDNFTMICDSSAGASSIINALKRNKQVLVTVKQRGDIDSYAFDLDCEGFASIFDPVAGMTGKLST